jgi:glycosyltransferase involved in cell wall biosynthesis
MSKVSAVINSCNEARLLRECIDSVRQIADDIVVCDMQSTDGSPELAKELGCRVIAHQRMLAAEPEARIASIEVSSGEWIFVFDPDMRISPETAQRLGEIVENDEADIVDFYCDNYFFGHHCPHGHGSQPVLRKMFKKACFQPVSKNIQTFWHDSLSGRVLRLGREHAITHLGYATVGQCAETLGRYAKREAEQAYEAGVKPSTMRLLWRPAKRFLGNYFMRQGFRDGMAGLIINGMVSWYLFWTEARLWELARSANQRNASPKG